MTKNSFLMVLVLSAFCLSTLQGPAEAAEFLSGTEVLIGADEVLNEDVYAFAGRVLVDGTINGDLIAAGESIQINGAVNGDLIVAARSITLNGAVEDDVRAAGAELQFRSLIGGDLIAAGDQIEIETGAVVGEDLVASASSLTVSGDVEGNLNLRAMEARITGSVGGNVDAIIEERLILSPETRIEGALQYTSQNDVTMQPGAEVAGAVTKTMPMINLFGNDYPVSVFVRFVSKIIAQAKWFVGTLLTGLILVWLFPATVQKAIATLTRSPWRSLSAGVLVFPLAALMLLLAMIVVLSIVGFAGFPIIAIPALLYAALLLLAKPAIAMAIGGYVAKRVTKREDSSPIKALAIGAAILAGFGLVPYADSVVGWLTLLVGFGMWLLFFYRDYREARATHSV